MALTPFPVTASNSSALYSSRFSSFAFRRIASPSGCSDPTSTLAATRRTSSFVCPIAGTISVTSGLPLVMVPVLSKTIVSISFRVCRAAPWRISTPFSAPMPLPTMRAVGVASPRAQGHAITRVETNAEMASVTIPRFGLTHGKNA